MKVSELEGTQLDYWVARAEGYDPDPEKEQLVLHFDGTCRIAWHEGDPPDSLYDPSKRWMWGGPIIDRALISIVYHPADNPAAPGTWTAFTRYDNEAEGSTPLVASMRAYVASNFGEKVPDTTD